MNIVLVIPSIEQGGAERVISELANEWANSTRCIHLVLLAKSDNFYNIDNRVIIHNLGFTNLGKLDKIVSEIRTLFRLRRLLIKLNPLFVLSFMEKYNIFTLLSSSFLGLKIFVSDRSSPLKKEPFIIDLLRRITYRYATGIIAQTNQSKTILQKLTNNKNIKVIPNPVKSISESYNVKKENIILNVGRLVPEKGQRYLIEAFSKLKHEDWKLIILGGGVLQNDLLNYIQELGLKDHAFLLGSVPDVDEWLLKSSIFVFPSVSEGFPNALVEAMSSGLPCISFDCDAGPRDIIRNGKNGLLVEVGNVDHLAQKIDLLINNEKLRVKFGKEAKAIGEELSKDKIAQQYYNFCTQYNNIS